MRSPLKAMMSIQCTTMKRILKFNCSFVKVMFALTHESLPRTFIAKNAITKYNNYYYQATKLNNESAKENHYPS